MIATSATVRCTGHPYGINILQDEARQLIECGMVSRQQPIYVLCHHIPAREWSWVEEELSRHDYLLRDRIVDLVGNEPWRED